MKSWLKNHFIPHTGNDHRPHILRKENTRNIILIVLFLEIFTFLIPTLTYIKRTGGMASVLPAVLSSLTNEERQIQKLPSLTTNPILVKAATMKAEDMANKGYFAHTSPEGKTPWYWLDLVGYKYQYAGENLAINFTDSKDVTEAWMNSPTHKANIVKDKYTEVGTGIANGIYEGKDTVFVVQIYANPIKKEATTPAKTITKEIKDITAKTVTTETRESTSVLGAETVSKETPAEVSTVVEPIEQIDPNFWQKVSASPRHSTNIIFFIIFGIIILSLILNIIIKIKHHHPDLVINGLVTLTIIGAVLLANYYFTHKNMVVIQSLDYSMESK